MEDLEELGVLIVLNVHNIQVNIVVLEDLQEIWVIKKLDLSLESFNVNEVSSSTIWLDTNSLDQSLSDSI